MKYYRDTYAEHPEDRENIEYGVRLHDDQSLVTLTGLYDQMRELGYDLRYARCELVSVTGVTCKSLGASRYDVHIGRGRGVMEKRT